MSMKRNRGLRQKLYRMTYDRPGINEKALRLKKSLDEVKKTISQLNGKKIKKKINKGSK